MPVPNYDKTFVGRYIRAIENPDSVGFKNGRWYKPPYSRHDPNNRGFGVDIAYNKKAAELTKDRGDRWLTEQEERDLRNAHIKYINDILEQYTPKSLRQTPSETKKALAAGLLYRGDGIKTILGNSSLRNAYFSGTDKDFENAVNDYYKSKNLNLRAERSNNFINKNPLDNRFNIDYFKPAIQLQKTYDNGGPLDRLKKWNDLSLREQSDIMAVAVRHGITSLQDIRDKWNEFAEGGEMPDTVGEYADAIYQNAVEEPYGDPSPHYNNVDTTLIQRLVPDARGHYDDAVKLPNHPSSPVRGTFNGRYFDLTDEGMQNPNYTLFGLIDNGDADTTLRYNGSYVLPEVTVTPQGNYYDDTYDNIRIMSWDSRKILRNGGYIPSKAVRDRISLWEGDSMKTNRSFSAEAKDFNRAIPEGIRKNLSQEQLDALYSYGYNVGMGNLRKRVLPALQNYVNGKAGAEDVANHMWASRDKDLRGLQRRRSYEKNQFVYSSPSDRRQSVVTSALNMDLSSLPSGNNIDMSVLPPNPTDYGNPVDYSSLIRTREEPKEDEVFKDDNGMGLLTLMSNLGVFGEQKQEPLASYTPPKKSSSFVVSAPTYNDTLLDDSWFAKGGALYDEGGYKGATIFRTPSGSLTTESGHPIEEIGWDNNGYMRYRDTVTGDLGHAFEPSEAYTKALIDTSRLPKKEQELEATYPEFDLIGLGGAAKNLTDMAYDWVRRKAAQKLSQKSANKAFTSELDWSPESWFGTRAKGVYDAEDVAALQSHVPEYLTIEQKAKADGTWLKMPDGSTWEGDPRSWVQLQSKDYKDAKLTGIPHYSGIDLKAHPLSYTPEYKGDSWTDLNMGMSKNWSGIGSPAHDGYIFQLDYPLSSKVYSVNAGGKDWNDLPSKIFLEKPDIYRNSTDDLAEQSARHGYDVTRIDNVVEGFSDGKPVTDVVIHAGTPRKSLIGNNGNFDMANPNIYKGLIYPFGIGWTLNSLITDRR